MAIEIVTTYQVPYIAGYNPTGTIIYIDRRVDEKYYKPLIVHELTEVTLMNQLGYGYKQAHEMATAAELASGLPVKLYVYGAIMRNYAEVFHYTSSDTPPDLDERAYLSYGEVNLIHQSRQGIRV